MSQVSVRHPRSTARSAARRAWPLVGAAALGVAATHPGLAAPALVVALATLIAGATALNPRHAVLALLGWFVVMGTIRRVVLHSGYAPGYDPLLLVGPAVVALLLVVALRRGGFRQRTPLSSAVLLMTVLVVASAANPLQGGPAVGIAGLLFVLVPMLWFWIARAVVDDSLLGAILRLVTALAFLTAFYGLYQVYVGFPGWDQTWLADRGYASLRVGSALRPFSSFTATSDFVGYLVVGLMVLGLRLGRRASVLPALGAMAILAWAVAVTSVRGAVVIFFVAAGVVGAASRGFRALRTLAAASVALLVLGLVAGQLGDAGVGGARTEALFTRTVTGLSDPLNPAVSTLPAHLDSLIDGLRQSLRNPVGRGVGATSIAADRFGSANVSTDLDPSNMAVALGLPGLVTYASLVAMGLSRAFRRAREQRDLLSLAVLAVLVTTIFQWLNGGNYALSPLPWIALGWLDRPDPATGDDQGGRRGTTVPVHTPAYTPAYSQVLRRHLGRTVAIGLAAVAACVAVSGRQSPVYRATAHLLLHPSVVVAPSNPDLAWRGSPEWVAEREAEIVRSPAVTERVRREIGATPGLVAHPAEGRDSIALTVESGDPVAAARAANAYALAYIEFRRDQISAELLAGADRLEEALRARLDEQAAPGEPGLANRSVLEREIRELRADATLATGGAELILPAEVPGSPHRPDVAKNVAFAVPAGILFALGISLGSAAADDSLRGTGGLRQATGLQLLGAVPEHRPLRTRKGRRGVPRIETAARPGSVASEAYRSLRTLLAVDVRYADHPAILVTSARPGEGKTTTALNLAAVLAQAGHRVVLVDLDLRRPRLHAILGVPHEPGATSVMVRSTPLDRASVGVSGVAGLFVVPSGPRPASPAELVGGAALGRLLDSARAEGAVVVADAPPILPVTDAVAMSPSFDAVVVVADPATSAADARRAVDLLIRAGARVAGTVLNRAPERHPQPVGPLRVRETPTVHQARQPVPAALGPK